MSDTDPQTQWNRTKRGECNVATTLSPVIVNARRSDNFKYCMDAPLGPLPFRCSERHCCEYGSVQIPDRLAAANFTVNSICLYSKPESEEKGMATHQIQDLIKTKSWFIVVAAVAAATATQMPNPFTIATRFSTYFPFSRMRERRFSFAWILFFGNRRHQ